MKKAAFVLLAFWLLFVPSALRAVTTVQPVTEVSAQQAVIRVRTKQASCTHSITEVLSGATPDDNNASLFGGANIDTRAGSVITGQNRVYVAGTRTSARASDAAEHSRSLKANTAYSDSVVCGTDAPIVVTFTTATIQFGSTYGEAPPFDSNAPFGSYAWPQCETATVQCVDPLTGAVMKQVTQPGWFGLQRPQIAFSKAIGGTGWTNPTNILNGDSCAGTTATCAQTGNTNSLFLPIDGSTFQSTNGEYSAGYSTLATYDDTILLLKSVCSSTGSNCNLSVCLVYFDSHTCNSAVQTVTAPTSLNEAGFPASSLSAWASTAGFNFKEWGGTPPARADFGGAYGPIGSNNGVTTSATAVTLNNPNGAFSRSYFNVEWNNAYLLITGSGCTDGGTDICQISGHPTDPEHLTLVHAPVTACSSPCSWKSLAAGFLISKVTSTGTITLGATSSYAFSAMFSLLAEGDGQTCSHNMLTVAYAADGVTPIPPTPGHLCWFPFQNGAGLSASAGVLALHIPATGEVRFLSPLYAPPGVDTTDASGDRNGNQITFSYQPWDATDGTKFYGTATSASGQLSIYQGQYQVSAKFKAYSHPAYPCGNCFIGGPVAPGQDATMPYPGGRWSDDPIVYTNITKPSLGKDVMSQINAAAIPSYNSTVFNFVSLKDIVGGAAMFSLSPPYQDAMTIEAFFNLATGNMTGWGDTFSGSILRWGGQHSQFVSNQLSLQSLSINPPGGSGAFTNTGRALNGPFSIVPYSINTGSSFSTVTALTMTGPNVACPANSYGFSGVNCIEVHTRDVCGRNATAPEAAWRPCPYNSAWSQPSTLQAGDGVLLPGSETMQAIVAPAAVSDAGCGTGCLDVFLGRAAFGSPAVAAPNGWAGYAVPSGTDCNIINCSPGIAAWINPGAPSPQTSWIYDDSAYGGHADGGVAPTPGKMTFVQSSGCGGGFFYKVRFNQTLAAQAGGFTGAKQIGSGAQFGGSSASITCQSYPSNEHIGASAPLTSHFFDLHAMNPSSGSTQQECECAIDAESYSLVSGTGSTYKFSSVAGGFSANEANYKTHPFGGYAGFQLLKDMSGPGSAISDSTLNSFCIALAAGECRGGSNVGDIFGAVAGVPPGFASNCYTDWFTEKLPCIMAIHPGAASVMQYDGSRTLMDNSGTRRLGMCLSGWGREYQFDVAIPESTGNWVMCRSDWVDGARTDIFEIQVPPTALNSIPRNNFVSYAVEVPAGAAFAEAQFGYAENGATTSFYCTSRQDACDTSSTPFRFESIDSRTTQSCNSGCTIRIPAIAGRALYYRIGRSTNGATWTYGSPQVGLVE